VQGCSNKEIAGRLNISLRTVKQHLRALFFGIRHGRKRVKPAIAIFANQDPQSRARCPKEVQVAVPVWEGLTNREIGNTIGTTEPVIKNHLRSTFDKPRRLQPAGTGDVHSHGGKNWPTASELGEGTGQLAAHNETVGAGRPTSADALDQDPLFLGTGKANKDRRL
jgi:DNA-binding CsgD family transcriptional regulator